MAVRHSIVILLFAAVAGSLTLLARPGAQASLPLDAEVPDSALQAIHEGRYFRASLILRDYLAARPDTTATEILLAAQAEAGWGDWDRVQRLLAGRAWLDTIASGLGWNLLAKSQIELGDREAAGESLARYLAVADDAGSREQGLAEMRSASLHRAAERFDEAAAAYERALGHLPQIEDWIRLYIADLAAAQGDTARVESRLSNVEPDLLRDYGWRTRLRAYRRAGDLTRAAATAERTATDASSSGSRRAEAWLALGEIRILRGDEAGARTALRTAMDAAPSSSHAVAAARQLGELRGVGVDDRLAIGRLYLRHGNLDRGIAGIQAYLDSGRGSAAERVSLEYELARALFRAGRYDEAERRLLRVAANAGSESTRAEALFMAARSQYRDGRQTLARTTFSRVWEQHPQQSAAAQALYIAADLDHDDGNLTRAAERYRRTTATGADVEEVGLAYMRLAGVAWVDGRFDDALAQWEDYLSRYPSGRRAQQAAYWAGLANLQLGREAAARERLQQARRIDPFSWYGGRAGELLGLDFWDAPMEPSPEPIPRFEADIARALARIDLLRELGLDDAASYELDRAKRHFARTDGALYALAEALVARGITTDAISLGWEIYRREGAWNPRLLRIVYPFPYRGIIVAEARARGVDPFLAAGLIRQESMFNARAVSPAGAIGLMQVMPATGRTLARQLDIRRFDNDLLKKAEINVHLGMTHLAEQLRAYGGRLPVVLAAYNAGGGRIDRWQQFPEFHDDELFSERIPFAETRDYVKIVQNNARIYAALYGNMIAERSGD